MEPLTRDDPRRVGGYTLQARLGAGGMGRVYLGRDVHGSPAAVKLMHPHLGADAAFRARFRREVAAAAQVRGPGVAQVRGADPDADEPWLVTEYVPGPALDVAVATHGPLPASTMPVFAAGLAAALCTIHAAGVVHRDLKPSNVLLTAQGPVVIDFGIARAADATSITRTGSVIGTPGYLAPEILDGVPPGPPADVFALGVVVAFAATGRHPYGEGEPVALLWRARTGQPDLTGVPAQLADAVRACLAADPARRPTAADLAAQLGDGVGPGRDWLPPAALPPDPVPPAPPRRHRAATVGVVAAVGVLAVAATVLATVTAPGTATPPAPFTFDPVTGRCAAAPPVWPDARWLVSLPDRVRAGDAVEMVVNDKFGPDHHYTYPLPLTVRVYAPDGTSTTATTALTGAPAAVTWPGSFTGAPAAYPSGGYTVTWTSADRFLGCSGFTAR